MDNPLEQNTNNALIELQEELVIEYKKSLMYVFLFFNLLIPILSVEGIFSWSIGILGSYKIINIYRSTEKDKTRQATKCLIVSWMIAIVYNLIVYYVTKIIIAKVV